MKLICVVFVLCAEKPRELPPLLLVSFLQECGYEDRNEVATLNHEAKAVHERG